MKTFKRTLGSVALIALAGLSTACGSTAYREDPGVTPQPQVPGPNPTVTPTPTPTPTPTIGVPPITHAFEIRGSGTATFTVDTDNLLKVRIRPDTAGLVGGTNYTAVYGCISYVIKASVGQSYRTKVMQVNGGSPVCPQGVSEQIIDFSSRLGPGHNSVDITVSAVQTDWKYMQCVTNPQMWLWPMTTYTNCESYGHNNNLYTTHVATGVIDIQVNGTDL